MWEDGGARGRKREVGWRGEEGGREGRLGGNEERETCMEMERNSVEERD